MPSTVELRTPVFPIRVNGAGRAFVDAAGRPFFWLGDTAWALFTATPRDDARTYLATRARQGFTVVQAVLAWGIQDPEHWAGADPAPNPEGQRPWFETPAQPNPRYFRYAKELVDYAAELGLAIAALPTWGYSINQAGEFDPASAHAYGRWLGQYFGDCANLVWVNGGDREPVGFEATYRALGQGLRAGSPRSQLISYHVPGSHSSSYYFHEDAWLDFNMIQTWADWASVYSFVASDVALNPDKPVVHAEGAYEAGPEYPTGPITPLIVRRQAYWAVLAGGFPTYGHNNTWRVEPNWLETLDTEGARSMIWLRRLFEARDWPRLVPDQTLFFEAEGSGADRCAAMRRRDRRAMLAYFPSRQTRRLRLDRIATAKLVATWFHPATGEFVDEGEFETGNLVEGAVFAEARKREFTPPEGWEDAVLLFDAVS